MNFHKLMSFTISTDFLFFFLRFWWRLQQEMASLETLQSMICHSQTVPSTLVRKDILIYEYFQTCLLRKRKLLRKSIFHFHSILKIPLLLFYQYINLGKDYCESLLLISLNIFANIVERFESAVLLSHHVGNIRKSCLKLNCNSVIFERL